MNTFAGVYSLRTGEYLRFNMPDTCLLDIVYLLSNMQECMPLSILQFYLLLFR